MKTERQRAIKKLDTLFSEYIRKRAWKRCGSCERAKYIRDHAPVIRWQDLDCAHLHSRRKYSTRWDERNAIGLCSGCHFYIDSNGEDKNNLFKDIIGERDFELLKITAEMISKNSPADFKLLEIYFKQKIKEFEG